MSKCELSILVERHDHVYKAGEVVRGDVTVQVNERCACNGLSVALHWRTHGRGNKASGPEERRVLFTGEFTPESAQTFPFEFTLPPGPVTYRGKLLNLDWYLSARADIPWAIDPKAETEVLVVPGLAGAYDFGSTYKPPAQLYKESSKGTGCTAAFFSIFMLAGLGLFAWGIAWSRSGPGWMGVLMGGLFFLVGAGGCVGVLWRGIAQKKLGIPEVRIGSSVVRPGDTVPLSLTLRPRAPIPLEGVTAELRGWEEVVSGSGTNRTTHREVVHRVKITLDGGGRDLQADQPVPFEATLSIPPEAAPTFAAADNEFKWVIELHVGIRGWPDWKREYPISVRPQAAAV